MAFVRPCGCLDYPTRAIWHRVSNDKSVTGNCHTKHVKKEAKWVKKLIDEIRALVCGSREVHIPRFMEHVLVCAISRVGNQAIGDLI